MLHTKYKGHETILAKQAAEKGTDIIVACGGSGTIFGILPAILPYNIPLALLPTGAGNAFSFDFGIKTLKEGLKSIQSGFLNQIDIGKVENQAFGVKYFLCYMGLGISSVLSKKVANKPFRGFNSYFIELAAIFLFRSVKRLKYRLKLDYVKEQEISPDELFIGNINSYGRHARYIPKPTVNDGLLDVVVYNDLSVLRTIAFLFLSNFGIYDNKNDFSSYYKVDQLSLFFKQPTDIQIDFEPHTAIGKTEVSILDKALNIYLLEKIPETRNI